MWYVGIHVVFVVSSVLLALSDRLSGESKSHAAAGGRAQRRDSCKVALTERRGVQRVLVLGGYGAFGRTRGGASGARAAASN